MTNRSYCRLNRLDIGSSAVGTGGTGAAAVYGAAFRHGAAEGACRG
jgi:hypothetical protein